MLQAKKQHLSPNTSASGPWNNCMNFTLFFFPTFHDPRSLLAYVCHGSPRRITHIHTHTQGYQWGCKKASEMWARIPIPHTTLHSTFYLSIPCLNSFPGLLLESTKSIPFFATLCHSHSVHNSGATDSACQTLLIRNSIPKSPVNALVFIFCLFCSKHTYTHLSPGKRKTNTQ